MISSFSTVERAPRPMRGQPVRRFSGGAALKDLKASTRASSAKSRHLEDQRVVVLESDEWCAQHVLELLVQASLGCGAGHL
jgi:hypothetical protein